MTKAEMAARIKELSGTEPSTDDHTAKELRDLLEQAQAAAAAQASGDDGTSAQPGADTSQDAGAGGDAEKDPAADPTPATENPAPPEEPAAGGTVRVVLEEGGPAGRLVVRGVTIDTRTPARIPRAEFERLREHYPMREVED